MGENLYQYQNIKKHTIFNGFELLVTGFKILLKNVVIYSIYAFYIKWIYLF